MVLVITEKPSVAKQIAEALGIPKKRETYYEVGDFKITYAFGHLLTYAEPEYYDEKYKKWKIEDLPIVPDKWNLIPTSTLARKQLQEIKKLWKDADEIICATDAGREGELIFRHIYDYVNIKNKPVKRLWLQSLTKEAIREQFKNLIDISKFDKLYEAALSRAKSDWLVGMNISRGYTLMAKQNTVYSIGRVQTPTLAIVVDREKEIQNFVSRTYHKVVITYTIDGKKFKAESIKQYSKEEAENLAKEIKGKTLKIAEFKETQKKVNAPTLPDLGDLQKNMSKKHKWSAQKTLDILQELYEDTVVTYPRTDSKYLPTDMKDEVKTIAKKLLNANVISANGEYVYNLNNEQKIFDNSKISDHYAVIPTGVIKEFNIKEKQILFDYVIRRFFASFYPPAVENHQSVIIGSKEDGFKYTSLQVIEPSFYELLGGPETTERMPKVDEIVVENAETVERKTQPPQRYTDGALIALMETAGKMVDKEELAEALKERGLGTPATRAEIIERLVKVGYLVRQGQYLVPTEKGMKLIDSLREIGLQALTSPEMTGEFEKRLRDIENSKEISANFLKDIINYVNATLQVLTKEGYRIKTILEENSQSSGKHNVKTSLGKCPKDNYDVIEMKKAYRCVSEKCDFVIFKNYRGANVTPSDVKKILSTGKSNLKTFQTKEGKKYKGYIILDKNGLLSVEFYNEKSKQKNSKNISDKKR